MGLADHVAQGGRRRRSRPRYKSRAWAPHIGFQVVERSTHHRAPVALGPDDDIDGLRLVRLRRTGAKRVHGIVRALRSGHLNDPPHYAAAAAVAVIGGFNEDVGFIFRCASSAQVPSKVTGNVIWRTMSARGLTMSNTDTSSTDITIALAVRMG